jgi:hypothetical protein
MPHHVPHWKQLLHRFLAWYFEPVYGYARPLPTTAPDGTVAADVTCRECGYNLRTLHVQARCPECDTPVAASVRGDTLMYCDPRWLRKLIAGADLLLSGFGAAVVTGFANKASSAAGAAFGIAAALLLLAGTWLFTRPDPRGTGEAWYGNSRKLACGLPFAAATLPMLLSLRDSLPSAVLPPDVAVDLLQAAIDLAVLAAGASILAMLAYVGSFAATRITADDLARSAASQLKMDLVMAAALALLTLALRFAPRKPLIQVVIAFPLLIGLQFSLVCAFRYVRLIWRVRHAINTQAEFGRQLWPPGARRPRPTGKD